MSSTNVSVRTNSFPITQLVVSILILSYSLIAVQTPYEGVLSV
jgi:hypothetical protein